jgi:aquaporin Z
LLDLGISRVGDSVCLRHNAPAGPFAASGSWDTEAIPSSGTDRNSFPIPVDADGRRDGPALFSFRVSSPSETPAPGPTFPRMISRGKHTASLVDSGHACGTDPPASMAQRTDEVFDGTYRHFFLVLTIGLTAVSGTALAPLAVGATLIGMVYMGGHVSGAHYNPAITAVFVLRGKLAPQEIAPYMLSQVAGAVLASLVVYAATGSGFAPAPAPEASVLAALLIEVLFTFALALVILHVATADAIRGNGFYGVAIGFTVAGAAFAGGPISGGAFNPAVGFGPSLVNSMLAGGGLADLWLYLVGPFLGAALATVAFKIQVGR